MKTIGAAMLIISAVVISGCVQSGTDTTTNVAANKTFTLEEVALHSTAADCWLAMHGKVYNVTGMIKNHGGGDTILEGCGKDATVLFETRPMGSGTPHSDKARGFAEKLYIGDLK
jgi:cytochrome b involved in lipid metabolism